MTYVRYSLNIIVFIIGESFIHLFVVCLTFLFLCVDIYGDVLIEINSGLIIVLIEINSGLLLIVMFEYESYYLCKFITGFLYI